MQTASMLQTSVVSTRCLQAQRASSARSQRRGAQQVCCAHRARENSDKLSLALASCAAALLLQSSPANAKVIFEKPQTKKVFQGAQEQVKKTAEEATEGGSGGGFSLPSFKAPSLPDAPSLPSAPSLPNFKAPSIGLPSFVSEGGDIDPRAVALPGALLLIGGGGFLLSKLDPQFDDFIGAGALKDSSQYAGYEQTLLDQKNGVQKNAKKVGATIKKQANKAGSKKPASSSKSGGLRGIFKN